MRMLHLLAIAIGAAVVAAAVSPAATSSPATATKKTGKKKTTQKKYVSSAGHSSTGHASAAHASAAHATAKPASPRATIRKTSLTAKTSSGRVHHRTVRSVAPVSAAVRLKARDFVMDSVASGANIPVENAAALVPFFEQLYRLQQDESDSSLHILHYGDSHTAADEWTGELRAKFQDEFGDGGSGFSLAGRPYAGYRRVDVRSGSTRDWHTEGLVGRSNDGIDGLGGISMSTELPGENVYIEADASRFELFYYQQPGGGSLELSDNGTPVDRISTDGEAGPGYYRFDTEPGPHRLELETLDHAPVRLFGWAADRHTGITYETLGINGAAAPIILDWDDATLRSNIEQRNPGLIVLAYGTNEAGRKDWTLESYRDMYSKVIARLREAAPAATILVIGPPDRGLRTRKGWVPMERIGMILEAQREAARANGCPFWNLRAKMGGEGSMQEWVRAGMAQNDHVHFTGAGYKMLGDAVFRDLMSQYQVFLKARRGLVRADSGDASTDPQLPHADP